MRSVAVAIVMITAVSHAEEGAAERAHDLYQGGLRAYDGKDYLAAIAAFRASYTLDPRPEVVYAWAQAERLAGHCPDAVDLYRKFLAGGPPPEYAKLARENLALCGAEEPTPAPPSTAPVPPTSDRPSRSPWLVSGALAGGGVLCLGVTVVYALKSSTTANEADEAPTYQGYLDKRDTANGQRTVAIVAGVAGSVLIAGGVVYYLLHRERERAPTVSGWLEDGGGGVVLGVEF